MTGNKKPARQLHSMLSTALKLKPWQQVEFLSTQGPALLDALKRLTEIEEMMKK